MYCAARVGVAFSRTVTGFGVWLLVWVSAAPGALLFGDPEASGKVGSTLTSQPRRIEQNYDEPRNPAHTPVCIEDPFAYSPPPPLEVRKSSAKRTNWTCGVIYLVFPRIGGAGFAGLVPE